MPRLGAELRRRGATVPMSCTSTTDSTPAATTKRRSAPTARSAIPRISCRCTQGPAGQGRAFAPGFNPANYPITTGKLSGARVPTANIFVDEDLTTPLSHEFTTSYGVNLGRPRVRRGDLRLSQDDEHDRGVYHSGRRHDHVVTLEGPRPRHGLEHRLPQLRRWRAASTRRSSSSRAIESLDGLNVNGHYTLQMRNHGNYEGEGTNPPGATSLDRRLSGGDQRRAPLPDGRLQNFQRHRLRLWTIYIWIWEAPATWRCPACGASIRARLQPGRAQSGADRDAARARAAAGYPDSRLRHMSFSANAAPKTFNGYGLFDTSINYDVPVFRSLAPWIKFDVYNVFNNQKLIAWNTPVTGNTAGPVDALGIPTTFTHGASFGTATGNTVANSNITGIPAYPQWVGASNGGRTFRVAIGLRF